MRFEPPAFRQIATDIRRTARVTHVYWALTDLLDFVQFRELKIVQVQHALTRAQPEEVSVAKSTVSSAIGELVTAGYLDVCIDDEGREFYRLMFSRRVGRTPVLPSLLGDRAPTATRPAGVVSEALAADE